MLQHLVNLRSFSRAASLFCFVFFLGTTFRYGWNRDATDFRNYYTGAVMLRKQDPLRNFYDANWFQRRVNEVGSRALGSYIPQTPLGMLPFVPFSVFSMSTARRIWLLFNLAFLGGAVWMLSRISALTYTNVTLLVFLGYGTLHANFLFGQYYVCLLFLITLSLFCLERHSNASAGVLLSAAFALKLYGGPFLIYLAVKHRWRAMITLITGAICFLALAVWLFGWNDIVYFGQNILPRALAGETIDPYNSLNNSFSTFLRRLFVSEPELNLHPLWNAPAAFFFLQPFVTLLIFSIPLLAIAGTRNDVKDTFAWFNAAALLASPNIGSYTYVLALLPVSLLLKNASRAQQVLLVISYLVLGLPMNSSWSWLFPKLWILLVLFVFAGRPYWRRLRPQSTVTVVCSVALLAGVSARIHLIDYAEEPEQQFEEIAVQEGSISSSSPAVLKSGIVYQALSGDRYALRWLHDNRFEEFRFNGHVIQPVAASPDGPIHFDLLANRLTIPMVFNVKTRTLLRDQTPVNRQRELLASSEKEILSPDKKWIVFTKVSNGNTQIWLNNRENGNFQQITGGDCSSWAPVWELDSRSILFASDCNRGIACPAIYRARLEQIVSRRPYL